MPVLYIIAGPNGAGKQQRLLVFYQKYLKPPNL
jgi:predicted ABC-type ATPase